MQYFLQCMNLLIMRVISPNLKASALQHIESVIPADTTEVIDWGEGKRCYLPASQSIQHSMYALGGLSDVMEINTTKLIIF